LNVDGELNAEPALPLPQPPLEVVLVLALKRFALAMPESVARIAFSQTGILGKLVLSLVVVVLNIVVVMSTCQVNFAPSWNALKLG
jgi:hypothetical protein